MQQKKVRCVVVQKVMVRGADGESRVLAFIRQQGETVYVCALHRYSEAKRGDEQSVVGFPKRDVTHLDR
jgi:hypothetical protein